MGLLSVCLYLTVYLRTKDKIFFNVFLFDLNLLGLIICNSTLSILPDSYSSTHSYIKLFSEILCALFIFLLPRFSHSSKNVKYSKSINLILTLLSISLVILLIISKLLWKENYYITITYITYTIMGLSILYSMLILISKKMGSIVPRFDNKGKTIAIITLIVLPIIFTIDILPETFYQRKMISENYMFFPFFYILLNINLLLIISKIFWNQDKGFNNFLLKYEITSRESDVLTLLIRGYSYKLIGEKLSISLSTVKSHISSIYKKTSTQNKLELVDLLRKSS